MEELRTALAERISGQRVGMGDPRALVGEMRRAVLLVPLAGTGLWSARFGGVRWVCAFTDETALAHFAVRRAPGDRLTDYVALLGARIVDEILPTLDVPAGLALDIASKDGAMFFPPVTGIVADAAAVDSGVAVEGAGYGR